MVPDSEKTLPNADDDDLFLFPIAYTKYVCHRPLHAYRAGSACFDFPVTPPTFVQRGVSPP